MFARINNAGNPDLWQTWDWLSKYLGLQLFRGEVALVLGAGASVGFGLPDWTVLTKRIAAAAGVSAPSGLRDEEAAEYVWEQTGRDDARFAVMVREALYADFSFDLGDLQANSLVGALGTLALPSQSGGVRQIVSFNFDDLVENYLRRVGFIARSVAEAPAVAVRADVSVLHPHGLLGLEGSVAGTLVFTAKSFDRVVGNIRDAMYRKLVDVMASHTCVFVGLSGLDNNLMSALEEVNAIHPHLKGGCAFWGVRFCREGDPRANRWETKGIFNQFVHDYNELPGLLFSIRERSAEALGVPA